ncbi:MAG TPA: hypothetical protein VFO96_10810 [Gemmatimonadales bacterium]|jgi:hypothetical protein|nr:hypothetical protein [Gemmatimonadales bacterium]
MDSVLAPVAHDLPLVAALALAVPDRVCGVWLDAGRRGTPFPVRVMSPNGWRTLLIGADLGALLEAVELALVDAGAGPVLLDASALRSASALELDDGKQRRCLALDGCSPEALLAAAPAVGRSRIRYLG